MILNREDDLTSVAKGRPDASPSVPPPVPTMPSTATTPSAVRSLPPSEPEVRSVDSLRLPPGPGDLPSGRTATPAPAGRSITESVRNLGTQLAERGARGLPSGTGQQMGPLFFDPEGADFTVWLNHFKNEVYRNWIVPQPALLGFRGHVDLQFTVRRDGTLANVKVLKSSGTPALDRSVQNALLGSAFLPLPDDYRPGQVTMQLTAYFNEDPSGAS